MCCEKENYNSTAGSGGPNLTEALTIISTLQQISPFSTTRNREDNLFILPFAPVFCQITFIRAQNSHEIYMGFSFESIHTLYIGNSKMVKEYAMERLEDPTLKNKSLLPGTTERSISLY